MKKIVPLTLLAVCIAGMLCSLVGFAFSALSFSNNTFIIMAVPFLVVSCVINAFPIIGGVIFISRICKSAMIVSIIAYAITLVSFILLLSR